MPAESAASQKTGRKEAKRANASTNRAKQPATPSGRPGKKQKPDQEQSSSESASESASESEKDDQPITKSASKPHAGTQSFSFALSAKTTRPAEPALNEDEKQALVRDALANLAKLGYHGLEEADLGKLNPPDVYEDELQLMAEVRAYFQVAYKVRASGVAPTPSRVANLFTNSA